MRVEVHLGDCRAVLAGMEGLFDSCVTDPPYHLTSIVKRFGAENAAPAKSGKTGAYARSSAGFMGQKWDGGDVAFQVETWLAIFERLKPGAHLVAFSGTRTFHRMVCAIEDAGFEIRDTLFWCYATGFPKSHDVSKGIDNALGNERPIVGKEHISNDMRGGGLLDEVNGHKPAFERDVTAAGSDEARQWEGWGTALKPSLEPICLARKPLSESSVARNVLVHGTGAINVDGCRISAADDENAQTGAASDIGRWPANLCHDGSEEVLNGFPDAPGQLYAVKGTEPSSPFANVYGNMPNRAGSATPRGDSVAAARFFFSAKAGPLDRLGTAHATVKPVDLMRWLCRLVTPPGGTILDPFAGSGTTGIAAIAEGFGCELIDIEEQHVEDIRRKLAIVQGEGRHKLVELNERRVREGKVRVPPAPLFGEAAE